MQRVLSTVFLLGLLVACAAAFAITEHLKLIKSEIYDTHVTKVFSPVCGCLTDRATIKFKLRSADTLTVTIVDAKGNVIDTLATHVSKPAASVTFHWKGRTSAGAIVPDGTYQAQVELTHRTILMPNLIAVDTKTPAIVSASDGDGLVTTGDHHPVTIRYLLGQKAHPVVYIGGQLLIRGRSSRPRGAVKWFGKEHGKALPAGQYVLEVGAEDVAGNVTPPADRKRVVVRIRALAVSPASSHVAPGTSVTFTIHTGAASYTWAFAGAKGTGTTKQLHLHAPSHKGRYRLVVTAQGHSTTALVTVGGK